MSIGGPHEVLPPHGCRSAMFSSASSRRSRATALTAASAYLKTSHIDASRHAGSVDCPLDHVKQNADPLMALHNPIAPWIWRQMIEATAWGEQPGFLIRDRDRSYGGPTSSHALDGSRSRRF